MSGHVRELEPGDTEAVVGETGSERGHEGGVHGGARAMSERDGKGGAGGTVEQEFGIGMQARLLRLPGWCHLNVHP
jgi:hypothetical protein